MLENLIKTIDTCVEYHAKRGDDTRVKQLKEKRKVAESKNLFGHYDDNIYLYLGEGKI